jgi:hypothetical protein
MIPLCAFLCVVSYGVYESNTEAVKCLSSLHDKYVIGPADKASNNIVFVCKSYYYECLIKELGLDNPQMTLLIF